MFNAGSDCTYVLVRHRHPNDTFAVSLSGTNITIYSNGTVYSLSGDGTRFRVNSQAMLLPYTVDYEVSVKTVTVHNQQYIHFALASGVHLLYNNGNVQLTVSGFYSNQMAGLCGNADYNSADEDEMIMPDMRVASNSRSFGESWEIGPEKCMQRFDVKNVSSTDEAVDVCTQFFMQVAEAQNVVTGHAHFYNACVYDVTLGKGHQPSVYAYVVAAHAANMGIDGTVP